jgi:hypothetical protein
MEKAENAIKNVLLKIDNYIDADWILLLVGGNRGRSFLV